VEPRECSSGRFLAKRHCPPPLVSFGLSPDEHFLEAIEIAEGVLPTEKTLMMDRDEAIKAVKLLEHRGRSTTAKLREIQQEGIRQVTTARDMGCSHAYP